MDTGSNAEIEYHIQKGAYDDFRIDNTTGVIVVASKLDFDRRNTYNIEIIARDHGEPALTGTTTLTANVINTNDKMPYFIPTTQKAEVIRLYQYPEKTLIFLCTGYGRCTNRNGCSYFGRFRSRC